MLRNETDCKVSWEMAEEKRAVRTEREKKQGKGGNKRECEA
jgi:hypothetical protein